MAIDLPQLVAGQLRAFLRPLTAIAEADDSVLALERFVRSCGWSPPDDLDPAPLIALVGDLEEALAVLEDDLVPDSVTEAIERIELLGELVASARSLGASVASLTAPGALAGDALADFTADVAARLLFGWLEGKGSLLDVAIVTGLVESTDVPASEDGSLTRPAGQRPTLRTDLLPAFLESPLDRLAEVFAPDGWDEPEGAALTNLLLRSVIGGPLRRLGGRWIVDPEELSRADVLGKIGRYAVVVLPLPVVVGGQPVSWGAELEFVSRADRTASGASGPAIEVAPFGTFANHAEALEWTFDASGTVLVGDSEPESLPALTIGTDGVDTAPGLSASLALDARHPLDLVIGGGRTGLTLGDIQLGVSGAVEDGVADVGFSLLAAGSSVGISTSDFGRIVSAILDFDATIPFDLGVEWSRRAGLRLAGSASLEVPLADGFDIGIIAFEGVRLAFSPDDPLVIVIAGRVTIVIGPVRLTFEGLGLEITIHLGDVSVEIDPVPPTRLEFTITSEAVNGGGFLDIDIENGRYSGGLALDIFGFGLSAIVIVDTELPGGADGLALFGSIGLEFATPIPLGFGFTLIGVGGLLALHRTLDIDGLAADLRTGAADSILFPDDLEEDADAVLAGLDTWFPNQDGSSVFGPVVQIGWGSPTIVTAQLGVVVTLPDLIIALLGSVEVLLPTPDAPVLSLRMDVLGAVDVPAGTVIVAASLHDSNLLGIFELSGDMGFYLALSGQPLFVLSVGGYHAQFDPPGALPAWLLDLRRTRAAVDLGEGVEVVLTSYVAVTSNTLQFGGKFRLEASVEVLLTTYSAEGWFSINVLLVLKPFKLVARATAGVSISAGDKELLGVDLSARLEGPEPWYATGHASFTFFGFDVDFGFEIGDQAGGEPREIHDVATDVVTALEVPGAWQAAEPGDAWASGVVMSDERPAGLWVRPDQFVELRQSVAPLNRTMTAYGEFTPALELIEAEDVTLAGDAVAAPEWLDDWFAPAQFDRLDDGERLSSPSYELMTAGVRFGDDGVGITSDLVGQCASVSRAPEESIFPDHEPKPSGHVCTARPAAAANTTRSLANARLAVLATTYTVVRVADGARADVVLGRAGAGPALAYADACAVVSGQPVAERSRLRVAPSHAAGERVTA